MLLGSKLRAVPDLGEVVFLAFLLHGRRFREPGEDRSLGFLGVLLRR